MKRGLFALAIAVAPATAIACGACVEDRIAATYDHAAINAALARHEVVFVAIEGPVDAGRVGARVTAAASRLRGVQAGTLRTSASPPAFSFVLDATQPPDVVMSGFRRAVGDPAARLTVLRIMREGVLRQPR